MSSRRENVMLTQPADPGRPPMLPLMDDLLLLLLELAPAVLGREKLPLLLRRETFCESRIACSASLCFLAASCRASSSCAKDFAV